MTEQAPAQCSHCLGPIEPCSQGCWYQKHEFPKMTPGQRRVFETIRSFYQAHGHSLSLRDIGARLSIRSTRGVADHINALLEKGYLRRNVKVARSWIPVLPGLETPAVTILLRVVEEWEALAESFLEQQDPAQQAAGMMAHQMAQSVREQIEDYHKSQPPAELPCKPDAYPESFKRKLLLPDR